MRETRRLLVVCVVLLLLCIPTQATSPPEPEEPGYIPWPWAKADWELVATIWDPPEEDLIDQLEFTVRFEYPSNRSGYYTTEIYLSDACPSCVEVPMEINFWAHQPVLGNQQLWMYWYVMEDYQDWWVIYPQQLGWDRRYHQFRIWIKMYASAFKFEVYDCDTGEVLFANSTPYSFYSITGDIRRIGTGFKFSHWMHNSLARWEGHWVNLDRTYAWRWDQVPWLTDGYWVIEKSEADRIDHGPVLHLYDDHPRACTSRFVWPREYVEPLFKTQPTPADRDNHARFVHELANVGAYDVVVESQAPVLSLDRPLTLDWEHAIYLPYVFKRQPHWNEVTVWYYNYP